MIRLTLALVSSILFAQQAWQGDVKQVYKLEVPSYAGALPVYGVVKKGDKLAADVEMYSFLIKLADLKAPAQFFRGNLEKQGFKQVKDSSGPGVQKYEMLNTARKLTAVVVVAKQSPATMLVGVTVMPAGTIEKANAK